MHRIPDDQRRARLAERHLLARRGVSVEDAVAAVVGLHATEPASVYLAAQARADVSLEQVHRALHQDRSVVKQLAMRGTLFAFPRELLPAVWASASARLVAPQRARLAKNVEEAGLTDDGIEWVRERCTEVLAVLRDGPATTAELRERLPGLAGRLEIAPGTAYGGSFPVAQRLMTVLAAGGEVVRGENDGGWHVSRPRWTLTEQWLGAPPVREVEAAEGYRELVQRWLRAFGPGTEADLVWWLGATKAAVRRALAELGTVEVLLEDGVGHVLADDLDDVRPPEPWAALLPVLDPTTMGWKQRSFYLADEDAAQVFDRNGNAGTTAWWDGRVVGCWVQEPDGAVRVVLCRDIGEEGVRALEKEAGRLTAWLDGHVVGTVYPSPLMRSAR